MKNNQTKIFLAIQMTFCLVPAAMAQHPFNTTNSTQPVIHTEMGIYSIDECVSNHIDQIKIFGKVKTVTYDANHYIRFNQYGAVEELKCTNNGYQRWLKNTYDETGRIIASHNAITGTIASESITKYVYNDSAYTGVSYYSYTTSSSKEKITYDTILVQFDHLWHPVVGSPYYQKYDVYGLIVQEGTKKIEYNVIKKQPVTITDVNHERQYLYNPQGQLVGIKFLIDGKLENWLDIRYDPNGKWIRERRLAYSGVHETILSDQSITHTVDPKGNWTSASVKDQVTRITTVVNRTIEYWE